MSWTFSKSSVHTPKFHENLAVFTYLRSVGQTIVRILYEIHQLQICQSQAWLGIIHLIFAHKKFGFCLKLSELSEPGQYDSLVRLHTSVLQLDHAVVFII